MKRIGLISASVVLLAAGCSFADNATTTLPTPEPAVTSTTTTSTTTTTAPPPTTTTQSVTTTTLASLPASLPIVSNLWEWTQLLETEYTFNLRYDGTYLAYQEPRQGPTVVVSDDKIVLTHTPPDDREWIIQDTELGDHWLAISENTEATGADQTHLVVYDLLTGEVVFEEFADEVDGRLSIANVSLSGRSMALAQGQDVEPNCVAIYDLEIPTMIDEICGDAPIYHVEMDGNFFAFDTKEPGCRTAWTGTLDGQGHNLVEHTNRECWSGSPVGGDRITLWFESQPDIVGIDTMIGENPLGETVGLGRGDNGTSEVCWNRAVWLSGDNEVRSWDGGDTVETIFSSKDRAYHLSCVGPWVTVATPEAIYTANMFTGSSQDACSVVTPANAADEADLAAALDAWVHAQFDDLPSDLEVSVGSAVGSDGWWVGRGGFSDNLEGAIFAWSPDGDISIAWSGNADSEYEIRQYMLSLLPEAPPALLGCIDVEGYAG